MLSLLTPSLLHRILYMNYSICTVKNYERLVDIMVRNDSLDKPTAFGSSRVQTVLILYSNTLHLTDC